MLSLLRILSLSPGSVSDEPKFKFRINEAIDIFRVEATSLLPANSTWMSSSLHNVRCDFCQFVSKLKGAHI